MIRERERRLGTASGESPRIDRLKSSGKHEEGECLEIKVILELCV